MKTTIEEIQDEITALNEALGIVENRTGNMFNNRYIVELIKMGLKTLDAKLQKRIDLIPVEPREREFDKYQKLGM